MNDPLIWARALHFAATMAVAGVLLFRMFVAEPSLGTAASGRMAPLIRSRLAGIAWIGLSVVVISGVAWLILLVERMSELPMATVVSEGVVWSVLSDTGFGHDWLARMGLAGILAGLLPWVQSARQPRWHLVGAALLATALVGSLAWAGHAAATPGIAGTLHLAADALHLVAASAWVGGLVPLALLLHHAAGSGRAENADAVGCAATLRFSVLGAVSVGALIVTGTVNSLMLVGNVPALIFSDYGRLLLAKIALFLVMLSVAAINRFWLTPRVTAKPGAAASWHALRQIERNSLIEVSIGAIIIAIVAVLGMMPPGLPEQAAN